MKNLVKLTWFRFFAIAAAIFLLLTIPDLFPGQPDLTSYHYRAFEQQLHRAITLIEKQNAGWLQSDGTNNKDYLPNSNSDETKPEDFSDGWFLYNKDSLIGWSNHRLLIPDQISSYSFNQIHVAKTANGWVCFIKAEKAGFILISLVKIQTVYQVNNDYLKNKFDAGFSLPSSVLINLEKTDYPLFSPAGNYLFSLDFSKTDHVGDPFSMLPNPWYNIVVVISCLLFFLANLFLFSGLIALFRSKNNTNHISGPWFLFVAVFLFLIRFCQSYFRFPSLVYQTDLFRPAWYSYSGFLPSPGDFLLILLIIIGLVFLIYQQNTRIVFSVRSKIAKFCLYIFSIAGLFGVFYYSLELISNLVINSSIPLNFNNIAEFSPQSAVGIGIVILLVVTLWLSSSILMTWVLKMSDRYMHLLLTLTVFVVIFAIPGFLPEHHWVLTMIILFSPVTFALIYRWAFYRKERGLVLQQWIWLILFFSGIATGVINHANQEKTRDKLDLMALRLTSGHNPVTEQRYEEVARQIMNDTEIRNLVNDTSVNSSGDSLTNLLNKRYFHGYWNRYHLQATLCKPGMKLIIQPQANLEDCEAWFGNLIEAYGIPTQVKNLFCLDLGYDLEYYLGVIPFTSSAQIATPEKRLYIELTLEGMETEPGYPSLLLETERDDIPGLRDFSYAIYRQGNLLHSVGNLLYPLEFPFSGEALTPGKVFYKDQEIHHFYRVNEDTELLIGYRSNPYLSVLTPFSYLFIVFALVVALGSAGWFFRKGITNKPLSLRVRVQLLLSGLILVTMIVVGIILTSYIIRINQLKNLDYLREKGFSVKTEIQHKFGNEPSSGYLRSRDPESFLIKLANVFFTDINLFDAQGRLLASSRMRIFKEGLVSEWMNPDVFTAVGQEKRPMTVKEETIGSLTFLSAYLPLYNDKGKLLCYINLPYFSKQDRLKNEITDFLVTFTNLYIFLILAGVFISVLLSNYITAPFVMLSGKMAALRLGHRNEKLFWKNRDEVGELVDVYNRMVEELERSALQMAAAEREGAWKSMARQVAHEIKNPLTPMKLSAQYLQKAAKEGVVDLEERIDRFTRTLVEQIDALAAIASDFSNFAKMPVSQPFRIDLAELATTIVKGYSDTEEMNYFTDIKGTDFNIFADRSRMTRILTNLINNATQSVSPGQRGEIRVGLDGTGPDLVMQVSDNGEGIPSDRADRIFLPDFTTKSSGMGLGLAIVKGIVEEMKGEIGFSANEAGGTTFTVRLPRNYEA
jgi:signal transduction histidine kinase